MNDSTSIRALLAVGALLALTSGCAAVRRPVVECAFPTQYLPPGPALAGEEYGAISLIPLNAVQLADRDLLGRVAVQSLRTRLTPSDQLRVHARLVNCTDRPITVNARTNFLASDHAPSEPTSAWRRLVIQPRALGHYTEVSALPGVAEYLVELRGDAAGGRSW